MLWNDILYITLISTKYTTMIAWCATEYVYSINIFGVSDIINIK